MFIFKLRLYMETVEPLQKALVDDTQSHEQVLIEYSTLRNRKLYFSRYIG